MRKRFRKPHHFLNKAGKKPLQRIREIFKNFEVRDFREEINLWLQLSLSNEQSAYAEGNEREDLLDFVQLLYKLIESFHVINQKTKQGANKEPSKLFSTENKKGLVNINTAIFLNSEEIKLPGLVIKKFCGTFPYSYARMEILDMLEAVITYDGNKKVYTGNLVRFYQHLGYLLHLAYRISKKEKLIARLAGDR